MVEVGKIADNEVNATDNVMNVFYIYDFKLFYNKLDILINEGTNGVLIFDDT